MTHAEPRGPVGALEWTRRLRVGEARLVAGGFSAAGPAGLDQVVAQTRSRREHRAFADGGGGQSLREQLLMMVHRCC